MLYGRCRKVRMKMLNERSREENGSTGSPFLNWHKTPPAPGKPISRGGSRGEEGPVSYHLTRIRDGGVNNRKHGLEHAETALVSSIRSCDPFTALQRLPVERVEGVQRGSKQVPASGQAGAHRSRSRFPTPNLIAHQLHTPRLQTSSRSPRLPVLQSLALHPRHLRISAPRDPP